ncbi:MAG: endo-1,4-beta-xylanase [Lachnospiraceae bacterium]|nr:endo-1,4-beta-xylanase [Lachnospiraceae bacterium]
MMGKWKRGIVVVLLAGLLAGCGTKESSGQPVEPTVAPITEVTAAPAKEAEPTPEPTVTPTPEPAQMPTIQEVLAAHNMKAGTCLSDFMIGNKKCQELIQANFNSITFENHLKPDAILNQQESKKAGNLVVKFNATTLKLLEWCKENKMAVRGHTLIWHSQTPDWIFYEDFDKKNALVSREVMLERMESYISQTFALLEELGYLELFYAYDVLNEAWMEDGTMRDSLWLTTIGEDYMWQAFYFADKYAPDYIDLYYNDYNEQYKTETLYNFVQTLIDENGEYLIDGIGFQAHLYTEDNLEDYFATVERLGSLGLKLNLTELDVCLGSWQNIKPAVDENLRAQGQYYYNLIEGLLKLKEEGKVHMDALTFWGFADKLSWRAERSPLLFNTMYAPKYAYYGALQIKELAGFEE